MAVNWAMWEAIGTVGATVVALSFGLYTILRGYKNRPIIVLEHDTSDVTHSHKTVDAYWLRITNKGTATAHQVNVRAIEAKQGDTQFITTHERYFIFTSLTIQNGDSYSANFIHNHINESWFLTPAGKDKKFPRKKTLFILLISGDNFPSYRKTIAVEPIGETTDLKLKL